MAVNFILGGLIKVAKKLLVINSDEIFFKEGNGFYKWLCGYRGLSEAYQELERIYAGGPQVLSEVFGLASIGLTQFEFERYIKEYNHRHKLEETAETLRRLSEKYRIMIFSSYPRLLFADLSDVVEKIFGSEYVLDKWGQKIEGLSFIKLTQEETGATQHRDCPPFSRPLEKPKNHKKICDILDRLGLNKVYNRGSIEIGNNPAYVDYINYCRWLYIEPDQYGMLVCLIDQMIEGGYEEEDIIVLGSTTAQPIDRLAGRKINNFNEL